MNMKRNAFKNPCTQAFIASPTLIRTAGEYNNRDCWLALRVGLSSLQNSGLRVDRGNSEILRPNDPSIRQSCDQRLHLFQT